MNEVKSGWKTTEFWHATATQIVGVGIALGLLTHGQGDAVVGAVSAVAAAAIAVVSAFVSVRYSADRSAIKSQAIQSQEWVDSSPRSIDPSAN